MNDNNNFAGIKRSAIQRFDGKLRSVLQTILIECNHTDNPDFMFDNRPFPLKRGQWITSLKRLSKLTGFSVQEIRTICGKLEKLRISTNTSTGYLTKKATLINVIAIDKFLVNKNELTNTPTKRATSEQQTVNKDLTINNKDNKETNKKTKNELQMGLEKFLNVYFEIMGKRYGVTSKRLELLQLRLKRFSVKELLTIPVKVKANPYYRGVNDRGWFADPDWILSCDDNFEKCVNLEAAAIMVDNSVYTEKSTEYAKEETKKLMKTREWVTTNYYNYKQTPERTSELKEAKAKVKELSKIENRTEQQEIELKQAQRNYQNTLTGKHDFKNNLKFSVKK